MIDQGSDAWHQQRLGKVTASKIADVMAKTKSGYGAARANYMTQLLTERLTGEPTEFFTNAAMQWGTETEPKARGAYAFSTGNNIIEQSFIDHSEIEMTGASPDGLVGDDGLIEIKCPNSSTHIATLLGKAIDGKYMKQMQWQMDCIDRQWCDFVSYDPRLPVNMQMHITRVERDADMIEEIRSEVKKFLLELDGKITELNEIYNKKDTV